MRTATPGFSSSIRRISEGATGAVAVATKIFWRSATRWKVSDDIRSHARPTITARPAPADRPALRTRFTRDDMNAFSEHVAGERMNYRVVAGRLLSARSWGFQYDGTRPDDPTNRPARAPPQLRALRVFGAWANLTDLKASNTLDTLVTETAARSSSTTCRTSVQIWDV